MTERKHAADGSRQGHALLPVSVAVVMLALAGCGVKSSPEYPPGASYPRQYPEALEPVREVPKYERQRQGGVTSQGGVYGTGPGSPVRTPAPPTGIYQYPNPSSYVPPEK